jgi:hypothetical protein
MLSDRARQMSLTAARGERRRECEDARTLLGVLRVTLAAISGWFGHGERRGTGTVTRRVAAKLAVVACVVGCLAATCSATASAKAVRKYLSTFGGSFTEVTSIAVDQSTGDVYVYDGYAAVLYKYDASGNPVEFGSKASNEIVVPQGSGSVTEIAVDNSTGPDKGDIYLVSSEAESVQIYSEAGQKVGEIAYIPGKPWGELCGVAVGSNGAVYVGIFPEAVNEYVPGSSVVSDSDYVGSYTGGSICNIGVDPAGNLFAVTWYAGPITAYNLSQFGAIGAQGAVVDNQGSSLAIDPATEDVFVNEQTQVSVFGPDGKPNLQALETFAATGPGAISTERESYGIAVNGATNVVYVANGHGGDSEGVNIFGPPSELPEALTQGASALGAKSATVEGEVDPERLPVGECYFEYGEGIAYGEKIPCAESQAEIGAGAGYVKVHAELGGLTTGAHYHYRLVAVNENGETDGADRSFTLALPNIAEEYATDVNATGADLGAGLSAGGNLTRYHFEYGTTASYGKSTAISELTGESPQSVQAHIDELLPETVYHYRLVATSAYGTVEGADQTFATEPPGGPLQLLDGRQWELVSPQEKHGAGIIPSSGDGSIVQAAASGDAITYIATNPIEEDPQGNDAPEESQIISRRGPDGLWRSRTLTTPNENVHKLAIGIGLEYRLFSPELTLSAVEPRGNMPLAPTATDERSTYVRDESACEAGASACFTPVLTREDTIPSAKWDNEPEDAESQNHFVDATEDMKHIVISAEVQLTEGAAKSSLYEWTEGHLENVSIDQAGQSVYGEFGGSGETNVRGAISSDGTRLFWQCEAGCLSEGPHALLMRDTATHETLRIDQEGDEARQFQIANEDGTRVFYTMQNPGEFVSQLWECTIVEVAGKLACERLEVAPQLEGLVLGIGSNGSTVYFVSNQDLAAGAQAGGENLYVSHLEGEHWVARFIATLAPGSPGGNEGDASDWGQATARVSPNGRYLTFISERSLTGFDNRDAASGAHDDEVFLYDDHTGKVDCVSCGATDARPAGTYVGTGVESHLISSQGVYAGRWVAADLPPWEKSDISHTVHQPRYLNDEGRMFFTSMVGLVPQDTNGVADVYEYEPDGVESCAKEGGCTQLISSGTSGEPSVFLEASESGDDVFFISTAQLTPQDRDSEYDVYDARVCSEGDPCTPAAVSPPPCSSGEACKPAQTPQPAIYGAPASATFSGTANPPPTTKVSSRSTKSSSKQGAGEQKLRGALKKCKRSDARRRSQERRCEAQARKRYGKVAKRQIKTNARDARSALPQAGQNGRGR